MERTKDFRIKILGVTGAVLMMCFMFVQLSLVSFAAEGKVKAQAAKIRASASTSSEQVGSAVRGEKYMIIGEETGADGHVWYKITFDANKTGYVRSDLMEKTDEVTGGNNNNSSSATDVTEVQPVSATITGSSVRVRSEASTSGSIIAGVVRDYVVTINGTATDSQGKTWYRVTYSAETGEVTGFIREDFLSVSGTITPVTDTPVVNDPVVNDPVVSDPIVTPDTPQQPSNPPVLINDYEVIEENGVWKLVDNVAGEKYDAAALIKANKLNPPKMTELEKEVNSQQGWIVFLVVLVIVLGIVVTLLFLKLKDVMDEAYFTAVEKETIRQRQGQKANNSAARNKPVMQTINTGNKQGTPKTTSTSKLNGANGSRPAQQKSSGTAPQTVKVSNPADTRVPKPVNPQQRPAGTSQPRPTTGQAPQKMPTGEQTRAVAAPNGQQVKNAAGGQQAKPVAGGQQPRPVAQRPAENSNKQSWQSKNFVNEEDDDFEFEFLNWDGGEEN